MDRTAFRCLSLIRPMIQRSCLSSFSMLNQQRLLLLSPFRTPAVFTCPVPSRCFHLSTAHRFAEKEKTPNEEESSSTASGVPPNNLSNIPDYVRNHVFLTDLPFYFIPHFWKSIRNRIFEFMIRGYFDRDFSIAGFIEGANQAVLKISSALADNDIAAVEAMDVLSPDLIVELKENLPKMTPEQREFLRVHPEDILRSFIYEIGVIMEDDSEEKYVEILFICHGQHGLGKTRAKLQADAFSTVHSKTASEATDKLKKAGNFLADAMHAFGPHEFVCNYRFIRQYRSPSVDSANASYWIINKLNHFRPLHYVLKHQFEKPPRD